MQLIHVVNEMKSQMESRFQQFGVDSKINVLLMEPKHALLELVGVPGSVGTYKVAVTQHRGLYEVLVISQVLDFDNQADIPPGLMVQLLLMNAKDVHGYWCLKKFDGRYYVGQLANIPATEFEPDLLREKVANLVEDCANIDEWIVTQFKNSEKAS